MAKTNDHPTTAIPLDDPFESLAFNGEIPFTITFELFGKAVKRKARIVFASTPEGEYFDLDAKALRTSDGVNSTFHVEVLTAPDGRARCTT